MNVNTNPTHRVIPGRVEDANPESITPSRGYGFRIAASQRPE
jgi:hypothetical protein